MRKVNVIFSNLKLITVMDIGPFYHLQCQFQVSKNYWLYTILIEMKLYLFSEIAQKSIKMLICVNRNSDFWTCSPLSESNDLPTNGRMLEWFQRS